MTQEQRSAIFRRAAELVRAGWCQRLEYDVDKKKCCLFGGIRKAVKELGLRCSTYAIGECMLIVEEYVGVPGVSWNDAPGRTKAEVVELLERLANGN